MKEEAVKKSSIARAPAVRIGGKGAPRRAMPKKVVKVQDAGNEEAKLESALSANRYKAHVIDKVTNCSFMGKNGLIVNYDAPEVRAVFHKDKFPVGYILKGEGDVLSPGEGKVPTFDLDVLKKVLAEKNIDVEQLVKQVSGGDKAALDQIVAKLKDVSFEEGGQPGDGQPADGEDAEQVIEACEDAQ